MIMTTRRALVLAGACLSALTLSVALPSVLDAKGSGKTASVKTSHSKAAAPKASKPPAAKPPSARVPRDSKGGSSAALQPVTRSHDRPAIRMGGQAM